MTLDGLFRELTPDEEPRFRAWAREHFHVGDEIDPLWHPVVRDEARKMEREQRCRYCGLADATLLHHSPDRLDLWECRNAGACGFRIAYKANRRTR